MPNATETENWYLKEAYHTEMMGSDKLVGDSVLGQWREEEDTLVDRALMKFLSMKILILTTL